MPGWAVIGWSVVMALPLNIILSLLLWQPEYATANIAAWSAVFYLGLFSMLIGFFAWNTGLAMGGVARVGQIQLTQSFFTIAIAAWLLSEPISMRTLLFALLVAITVLFGRRARIGRTG
jgi:drug/metabolite transporter (DMT)-like permease